MADPPPVPPHQIPVSLKKYLWLEILYMVNLNLNHVCLNHMKVIPVIREPVAILEVPIDCVPEIDEPVI